MIDLCGQVRRRGQGRLPGFWCKWVNNDGMSTAVVCVVLLDSSGSGNVTEVEKGRLSWR